MEEIMVQKILIQNQRWKKKFERNREEGEISKQIWRQKKTDMEEIMGKNKIEGKHFQKNMKSG